VKNTNTKKIFRNTSAAMVGLFLLFSVLGTAQAATGINKQINF
jgi:hypothetical protein